MCHFVNCFDVLLQKSTAKCVHSKHTTVDFGSKTSKQFTK